jgi:ABC-type multidrug transport system ATPase subunit
MTAPAVIALQGISKTFQRRRRLSRLFERRPVIRALEQVDLAVAPGEIVALLGANGSGKTTLLRIMADILLPTSGELRRAARRFVHISAAERQFQERLTGFENLRFFARLAALPLDEIRPSCLAVGLDEEVVDQPVWTYTTGMKVRLAMARAFMGRADLVLLDEPTRSLDLGGRAELRQRLFSLRDRDGAAIVLAGHDLETAASCDRAILLSRGALRWQGSGRAAAALAAECARLEAEERQS